MRPPQSALSHRLLWVLLVVSLFPSRSCLALGEAYDGLPVAGVTIEGLPRQLRTELKKGLRLPHKPGFLGVFGATIFDPEILERVLERTRLYLARRGYPSAQIETEFRATENGDGVEVVLRIFLGPPVLVDRIERLDFPEEIEETELLQAQAIRAGDRFEDAKALEATSLLREEMRKAGYADAILELGVEVLDAESVALRFKAVPGPHYLLGELSVAGPSEDLIPVVVRVIEMPTGTPYSPARVADVEWRLRSLMLFRRIDMTATPEAGRILNLDYQLTESSHKRFEIGLGWFTDEKWRAKASWEHRNLFKAGRGFRVSAVASTIIQNFIMSTWWPAVWSTPYTSVLSLDLKLEDEQGYDLKENKLAFTFVHRPRNGSILNLGYSISYIDLADNTLEPGADQDPEGLLNRVFFSAQLDKRDDLLNPTSGRSYLLRLQATPPVIPSVGYYAKSELGLSSVHRLKGWLFLAWRTNLGTGIPFADSEEIIISERFFAGGARSHRGYQRQRLGPKDALGTPLGGEIRSENSAELRFPLWNRLGGALFVDVAQVWRSWDVVLTGGFEWAVGPSISVNTPVGPIRLDYGFRVPARDDGEPNQVLHLQVGHPF